MQTREIKLYSLSYLQLKTYLVVFAFLVGNIALPQLCHLVPGGGLKLLPIYFFTLIGSYKYGWRVGLLTAVLSPIINNLLFGMPPVAMLPMILAKSVILALVAGFASAKVRRQNLLTFLAIVLVYQVLGTVAEWAMVKDFYVAVQDFRLGIPGMALQVIGGYCFVKYLMYK
ncbi:MAG: ECF transporter S component [Rikenellaceae bacterium]